MKALHNVDYVPALGLQELLDQLFTFPFRYTNADAELAERRAREEREHKDDPDY